MDMVRVTTLTRKLAPVWPSKYDRAMAGKIIYGLRPVQEALAAGGRVNRLYLAKEQRAREAQALVDLAREQGIPFDFVPQAKVNSLTGTQEHQGVAAAVSPVEYQSLESCLAGCGRHATLLVLDQVQHPRNVGILIRSAMGAGARGVLISARGGALIDEDILRYSAGAVFHVPVVPVKNMSQALRTLRDHDFWIYSLAAGGRDLFEMDWPGRCALVAGNETKGTRPGVSKNCDETLGIPLANGLDSLNVAVAASVALFQIASHRRRASE
ncbi:MAG: 23S rRNA (guanosine(2251)-2'-O)-methyltransferase RlmB [Candidatus Hydrogenedentes bacterium]|nr:23S rRNA (guanosine(2251)-2'-O)-methyltransferase RlmB [Candidatus Hydrogenedentota bacterium]